MNKAIRVINLEWECINLFISSCEKRFGPATDEFSKMLAKVEEEKNKAIQDLEKNDSETQQINNNRAIVRNWFQDIAHEIHFLKMGILAGYKTEELEQMCVSIRSKCLAHEKELFEKGK